MKKQVNRFPSNDYRAYDEDLFQLATPGLQHQQSSKAIDTMDNIEGNQKIRKAQLEGDGSFQSSDQDNHDGDDDNEVKKSMMGGAQTVMNATNNGGAKLQDFNIKKMIGRGTFGKVYIVEHSMDNKLYAMKCIRKDLVLEN